MILTGTPHPPKCSRLHYLLYPSGPREIDGIQISLLLNLSGLHPNNLQNTYEESLGYSDVAYTQAVDSGSYTNFATDRAGYGLAQWTVKDRKEPLLAFAAARGSSIGDLDMQLAFLCYELETRFPEILSTLKNAKSVREASDCVLLDFERPLNQDEAAKAQRAANGSVYYSRYGQ